ncbi:MAG: O-antigen ligase family protein, partial [Bacteroidota bacterium]
EKIIWLILIPLLITNVIILFRYSLIGFDFSRVNSVLDPFYRNKVNYASFMVCFLPFIVYLLFQQKKQSFKWFFLIAAIGIQFIALYYTYTRAVYVTIAGAVGFYFIYNFKLAKLAVMCSIILSIAAGTYLTHNNTYLDFAPDYNKTIYHDDFGNLLDATTKLQDISTMERVYRWVAAYYMIKEKPLMGFGPGNFYSNYKNYTVRSFETYVSDNEEQSGVHSYYLMTFVEQGLFGFIFFIVLCLYVILKAERIYHKVKERSLKHLVMAASLSLIIIFQLLIINDMVETDKVGSFFFFNMALLILIDLKTKDFIKT